MPTTVPLTVFRRTVSTGTSVTPPAASVTGIRAPSWTGSDCSCTIRRVTVRSALMLGVINSDWPTSRSSVIGVLVIVLAVPAPVGTTWPGVKPTVNGSVSPMKIRLTSLLAVNSNGVASVVTRLLFSSNCRRIRKLSLTAWKVEVVVVQPRAARLDAAQIAAPGPLMASEAGGRILPLVNPPATVRAIRELIVEGRIEFVAQSEPQDFHFQQHQRRRDVQPRNQVADLLHRPLVARADDDLIVAADHRDKDGRLAFLQELADLGPIGLRLAGASPFQLLDLLRRQVLQPLGLEILFGTRRLLAAGTRCQAGAAKATHPEPAHAHAAHAHAQSAHAHAAHAHAAHAHAAHAQAAASHAAAHAAASQAAPQAACAEAALAKTATHHAQAKAAAIDQVETVQPLDQVHHVELVGVGVAEAQFDAVAEDVANGHRHGGWDSDTAA